MSVAVAATRRKHAPLPLPCRSVSHPVVTSAVDGLPQNAVDVRPVVHRNEHDDEHPLGDDNGDGSRLVAR
ncbi:hypothetical protein [Photobacterium indicum]|uniref:hypothetical protein n=1 Tax=Photobacterium indicum TaxID=81447 RepID=UPI003D0CF062